MASSADLLALLGRRLFTTQTGLLAGFLFAVVPTVTRYGQEIRPYAFALAAVLLSTLLLARALEQPGFKVWVGYTLTVPMIGWSHLASLAVLGAHVVMVLMARRSGDRIVGWAYAAAGTVGLCFVIPMAIQGTGQSGQIAWNNPLVDEGPGRLPEEPLRVLGGGRAGDGAGRSGPVLRGPPGASTGRVDRAAAAGDLCHRVQLHLFLPR